MFENYLLSKNWYRCFSGILLSSCTLSALQIGYMKFYDHSNNVIKTTQTFRSTGSIQNLTRYGSLVCLTMVWSLQLLVYSRETPSFNQSNSQLLTPIISKIMSLSVYQFLEIWDCPKKQISQYREMSLLVSLQKKSNSIIVDSKTVRHK